MPTSTLEIIYTSGVALTVKVFADGSDVQSDSQSAAEQTNRKGVYLVSYTDLADGLYRYIAFIGSIAVASGMCQMVQGSTVKDQSDISGDAKLAKQNEILAVLAARANPLNEDLNPTVMTLIHGDTYDGAMHPKKSWATEKDYSGNDWSIKLVFTKHDSEVVVKQVDGEAESAELVSIPTLKATFDPALELTGCPPSAKLGFAVVAINNGKEETIALGTCYVTGRGAAS